MGGRRWFVVARVPFLLIVLIGASAWIQLPAEARVKSIAGDEAFVRMEYDSALSVYSASLHESPAPAEILWRMARLCVCLADISPEDQQMDLFKKAEEFARQSIAADSTISEGHTWRAAALGSMAMEGSAKEKVQLCREIKQELDIAIALNPEDDAAYSILGSFYRALGNVSWIEKRLAGIFLGGLPGGGFEDAEQALRKAISLDPHVFRHHYELGRLYADWDRPQDAVTAFTRAIEVGPMMAADKKRIERAREMIAKLQDRG
jgi:tetratricopeptide (TPR) repeat protein